MESGLVFVSNGHQIKEGSQEDANNTGQTRYRKHPLGWVLILFDTSALTFLAHDQDNKYK